MSYNFIFVEKNFDGLGFLWELPLAYDSRSILQKWTPLKFVAAAALFLWLGTESWHEWDVDGYSLHLLPAVKLCRHFVVWFLINTVVLLEACITIITFWSSWDCVFAVWIGAIAQPKIYVIYEARYQWSVVLVLEPHEGYTLHRHVLPSVRWLDRLIILFIIITDLEFNLDLVTNKKTFIFELSVFIFELYRIHRFDLLLHLLVNLWKPVFG